MKPAHLIQSVTSASILMLFQISMAGLAFAQTSTDTISTNEQAEQPIGAAETDVSKLWLFSVGIPIAIEVNDVNGSSTNGTLVSPSRLFDQLGLTGIPLRPRSAGESRVTAAVTGGVFSIETPELPLDFLNLPIKSGIRLFGSTAVEVNLAADVVPNSEGGLGPVQLPVDGSGSPPDFFTTNSILGQGSEGLVEANRLQIRASGGFVIPIQFGDRTYRIKPSVEYLRRELDFTGSVTSVVQLPNTGQGIPNLISSLDETRIEQLTTSKTQVFDGVGPGLAIEVDVARAGDFLVSLGIGFKAFRLLGDLDVNLVGQSSSGERISFKFELDEWVFRGDGGVIVRWQPE